MRSNILIIDDDLAFFKQMEMALAVYHLVHAKNSRQAGILLASQDFDLILLDLNLDESKVEFEGLRYIRTIREKHPLVPIIVLSKHVGYKEVSEAMRNGALSFFNKNDQVLLDWRNKIQQAIANKRLLEERYPFVGVSHSFEDLKQKLRNLDGKRKKPLLLMGEAGTGKQTAARYFHHQSNHRYAEFVVCEAQSLQSAEELKQVLHTSRKGTLYLYHLDRTDAASQKVILEISRAIRGESGDIKWNGQLIAASQEDLAPLVESQELLPDLYYEFQPIRIPALRERPEDIEALLIAFLREHGHKSIDKILHLKAKKHLQNFDYPLNVKQLKHIVSTMLINMERLSKQQVDRECLPKEIRERNYEGDGFALNELDKALAFTELDFIERALRQALGIRGDAAMLLGIKTDDNLRNRVAKYSKKYPDLVWQFPKIIECYPKIIKKR